LNSFQLKFLYSFLYIISVQYQH